MQEWTGNRKHCPCVPRGAFLLLLFSLVSLVLVESHCCTGLSTEPYCHHLHELNCASQLGLVTAKFPVWKEGWGELGDSCRSLWSLFPTRCMQFYLNCTQHQRGTRGIHRQERTQGGELRQGGHRRVFIPTECRPPRVAALKPPMLLHSPSTSLIKSLWFLIINIAMSVEWYLISLSVRSLAELQTLFISPPGEEFYQQPY